MPNEEYKKIAPQILDDAENYENQLKQKECNIIHISEVFLIKMQQGIATLDEKTFPHYGANQLKKLWIPQNDENKEHPDDISSQPPREAVSLLVCHYLYSGIQSAIQNHTDPEYMLSSMGVKNTYEVISQINKNSDDEKGFLNFMLVVWDQLLSDIGADKCVNICLWGMASAYGKRIINFCKYFPQKDFLVLLKVVECIGKKYYQVYQERMPLLFYYLREIINNRSDNIKNDIPEEIFNFIIDNRIYNREFDDISEHLYHIMRSKWPQLCVDICFLAYYYIYENPQYIINLGFTLISEKTSAKIQSAIFPFFYSQDYAPLIQYEYEWWCKETGKELPLPFPFFKGIIDLRKINITDYDLNNRKQHLEILSPTDVKQATENNNQRFCLDLKSNDNTLRLNSSAIETSGEIIFDKLKVHLCFVRNEDQRKAGASFRDNHLIKVVNIARKLNNCYSVYGFACILFFSKYFDWKDLAFNKDFVAYIVDIFNIDNSLIEGTCYNFSKSKDKATQILKKKDTLYLNTLLDNKGRSKLLE